MLNNGIMGPDDFLTILKTRRTVRKYKKAVRQAHRPELAEGNDVSDETIRKVIDLARWAPSGANRQPWRVIVVKDPETKRALKNSARAAFFDFNYQINEAPVVLVICSNPHQSNWHIYDSSNLTLCLLLAAHYYGLGTCWIGLFNESKVKGILGIPEEQKVIALVTMGYADEIPSVPPRLEQPEITYYEKWGKYQSGFTPQKSTLFRRGVLSVIGKVLKHFFRGSWK